MRVVPIFLAMSFALAVPAAAQPVTIDDVRNIAFNRGIATLKKVELDDAIWEVKGYDASGHKIEMKVDARSGAIIKLKRHD